MCYWNLHLGGKHAWGGQEKPFIYTCFLLRSACSFLILCQTSPLYLPSFSASLTCLHKEGEWLIMRLLDLNFPTPFNVASGWRKDLSLGLSCIYSSPPAVAVTLSLSNLFSTSLAALESCGPVSHNQNDAWLLWDIVIRVTGGGAEDNWASKGREESPREQLGEGLDDIKSCSSSSATPLPLIGSHRWGTQDLHAAPTH